MDRAVCPCRRRLTSALPRPHPAMMAFRLIHAFCVLALFVRARPVYGQTCTSVVYNVYVRVYVTPIGSERCQYICNNIENAAVKRKRKTNITMQKKMCVPLLDRIFVLHWAAAAVYYLRGLAVSSIIQNCVLIQSVHFEYYILLCFQVRVFFTVRFLL